MSEYNDQEIFQWLAENGLPSDARAVFQGFPNYSIDHPINLAAQKFFQNKKKLIKPLTEVAGLLKENSSPSATFFVTVQPNEVANILKNKSIEDVPSVAMEWHSFAKCLLSAAAELPISPWEPPHDKLEEVSEIRRQIFEKSIELVLLAHRLTQIDGEKPPEYSSRSWSDLLKTATDIQNNNEFFVQDICSKRNGDGVDRKEVDCHDLNINPTLDLFEPWQDYPMPIIESVILAYGKTFHKDNLWLGEHSAGFDPFRFSSKRGAGDFVRGFTYRLKSDIHFEYLPGSIQKLSFSSINKFAEVVYPYVTPVRADRYITAEWFPKKDTVKGKEDAKIRANNKECSRTNKYKPLN